MAIVRNAWGAVDERAAESLDPEALMLHRYAVSDVHDAPAQLQVDFREVIVVREMEGVRAAVVKVPIGAVMSRLARARARLLAH